MDTVNVFGQPWAERLSLIKMIHSGALSECCRWKVSMDLNSHQLPSEVVINDQVWELKYLSRAGEIKNVL